MRIRDKHIHRTVLRRRYGSVEWIVLYIGLKIAQVHSKRMLSTSLGDPNDERSVIFLDDVLVYSRNVENYKNHLHDVLDILKKKRLYVKRETCELGISGAEVVENFVTAESTEM